MLDGPLTQGSCAGSVMPILVSVEHAESEEAAEKSILERCLCGFPLCSALLVIRDEMALSHHGVCPVS